MKTGIATARDVGSEDIAEREEAGDIDHPRDDAEQGRKPFLQARQLQYIVGCVDTAGGRGGLQHALAPPMASPASSGH
jgi:hypothetical protein